MDCKSKVFLLLFLFFFIIFLIVFFIIQSVAFITLFERHLLRLSQNRLGPNKVSFFGLVQAIIDGVKLLKKEQILPFKIFDLVFLFVPGVSFVVMFFEWFTIPFFWTFFTFEFSFLFLLCAVGFSVYSMLLRGIVSKSKYGIIGSIRARSQSVSYEIAFSLYFFIFIFHVNVFSFFSLFNFSLVFVFLPFLLIVLGELNRAPFDFSEGERELVSGFNTEFSSVSFVLLFLREYGILIFFSVLFSIFFFKFSLSFIFVFFSILIFVRSSFPRFRYDLIMFFFWFLLLPVSLFMLFYFVFFFYF